MKKDFSLPEQVIIATRESPLALWQANHVADWLRTTYPSLRVELLCMTTRGDQILEVSLSKVGGKGLFVKELETALLDGRADIAVHSMKDVPVDMPDGFVLTAIGVREDPRDALVCPRYAALDELPSGARVGTSSLRRECQLRAQLPHLQIEPLRGNLQTRLRKLDEGQYDAIILACAGLIRLGLEHHIRHHLPVEFSLPAVGQGALGIECLTHRDDIQALLAPFNDAHTADCVRAERSLSRRLGGSCQLPLAAFAQVDGAGLWLRALVASPDGHDLVRAEGSGLREEAEQLGQTVAEQLLAQGADRILAAVQA